MIIGILTYHWVYNMGANLQAFSTYKAIEKLGHNPILINYIPIDDEIFQKRFVPKEQIELHRLFVQQMKATAICRNSLDIMRELEMNSIDCVIIGSDAVFNLRKPRRSRSTLKMINPLSDSVFPNPFFGDFTQALNRHVPIAALSVSCQNTIPSDFKSERKQIGDALNKFVFISVRDTHTSDFIAYFTNNSISPTISPDPVFHFNQSCGILKTHEDILKQFCLPENYVLITLDDIPLFKFSDDYKSKLVDAIKKNGLFPVDLPKIIGGSPIDNIHKIPYPLSPIDWYYLLKYSKGYIGTLMHPIVVCLHNNVPFYSFDSYGCQNVFGIREMATSKTYHIVNKSGQMKGYFHCNPLKPKPRPCKIIDAIVKYDREKGARFALQQAADFETNLMNIINAIKSAIS